MIQFFCRRFRTRADGSHDESGLAMIIAITVVMLMTMIPLALVQGAVSQLPLSRHDQDHEAALAAAEAGVDDYMNRLAQNSNYWTYSVDQSADPGQPRVHRLGTCRGPRPDRAVEPERGVLPVPARLLEDRRDRHRLPHVVGQAADESHVELFVGGRCAHRQPRHCGARDSSTISGSPTTRSPTPRCPVTTRPHASSTRGSGTPRTASTDRTTSRTAASCTGRASRSLNGPVHSNDGLYVCGSPTFNGDDRHVLQLAATSNNAPNSKQFGGPGAVLNPLGCSNSPHWAAYASAGQRIRSSPFPPANTSIRTQADSHLGGTGCLYTGPTTITLLATGKMNVTSPATLDSNCATGTNVSLPTNGVVYVQNVPAGTDPNHSACSGSPVVTAT